MRWVYSKYIVHRSLFFVFYLLLTTYCLLVPGVHAAPFDQVCFGEHCLTVEVASDNVTRMRGLQGRTSLEPDAGMLFIFPAQNMYNFWMKDTLIPLDMIWLDESKHVVDVKANVLVCLKDPCPIYVPSQKARYVLETNASYAQAHNIQLGDQAVFK